MRTPPAAGLGALLFLALATAPGCRGTADSDAPAALAAIPATVADDWKGRVVVADFWATWCGPCRASSPRVQALHDEFASDPQVLIVGVHADDGVEDPGAYMTEHQYTYPLVAKGGDVADAFGVNALPTFVVLDQEGREVLRHVGLMTDGTREKIAAKVRSLRSRG